MSLLQAINPFKRFYNEQRRSLREHVNFPAWIAIGKGTITLPCIILDVSEHGARIELASPAGLPNDIYLFITMDGSRRRRCRIAWRSETQIGVGYIGPIEVRDKAN